MERSNTESRAVSTTGDTSRGTEREENLLIVTAVEGYSRRHKIPAHETIKLFNKFGIMDSIRRCYGALHTQDIYECIDFAEDIIKRMNT